MARIRVGVLAYAIIGGYTNSTKIRFEAQLHAQRSGPASLEPTHGVRKIVKTKTRWREIDSGMLRGIGVRHTSSTVSQRIWDEEY